MGMLIAIQELVRVGVVQNVMLNPQQLVVRTTVGSSGLLKVISNPASMKF